MKHAGRVMAGVGNGLRGDDAAGLEVARLVRGHALADTEILTFESETTGLMESFERARLVIVADAAAGGGAPGEIHRFDLSAGPLAVELASTSTHGLGLYETIELARLLGRLRARVIVYAITGEAFAAGEGLSPPVARASRRVTDAILRELDKTGAFYGLRGHPSRQSVWGCPIAPSTATPSHRWR